METSPPRPGRRLAPAVAGLESSVIREMSLRAARYPDVISLGIGEPDFHTPAEVSQAALADALGGATHYTLSQGDPELRSALARYLAPRYGAELGPADVLVTGGGMGALAAFFRAVLEPGDEVLVPEPHFPCYQAHVELAGGRLVRVPTAFEDGFVVRPEAVAAAAGPRARVLLLNSPCNPTGAVLPGPVLDGLARVAQEHDLLVLSDEVYDRVVFPPARHESIATRPGMAERTCVVGSFSKSFAMTGWRIGWALGAPWLLDGMLKVVTYLTSCAPSVSQRAALAALRHDGPAFEAMVDEFSHRCRLAYERLSALPGVRVHRPEGSFYLFPHLEGVERDTVGFALELLDRERVVVVPGTAFGPSGAGCVRIACTVGTEALGEAMDRLGRALARWRG